MNRQTLIAARRAFALPGYTTYAQAGFDGDYVSPYHLTCGNPDGPVLISYNWLDAPSAAKHHAILARIGHLPQMLFNRVIDRALAMLKATRAALYVTHAFHLMPATRSASVPARDVDASFDAITRHEIGARPVTALGHAASRACTRHGIAHRAVPHPSARGHSIDAKATRIADALRGLL